MKLVPKATTDGVGALDFITGVCFLESPTSEMLVGLNLKLWIGVFEDLEDTVFWVCGEGAVSLLTATPRNVLLLRNVDVDKAELFLGDFLELTERLDDASPGPRTLKLLRESIQLTDNELD